MKIFIFLLFTLGQVFAQTSTGCCRYSECLLCGSMDPVRIGNIFSDQNLMEQMTRPELYAPQSDSNLLEVINICTLKRKDVLVKLRVVSEELKKIQSIEQIGTLTSAIENLALRIDVEVANELSLLLTNPDLARGNQCTNGESTQEHREHFQPAHGEQTLIEALKALRLAHQDMKKSCPNYQETPEEFFIIDRITALEEFISQDHSHQSK